MNAVILNDYTAKIPGEGERQDWEGGRIGREGTERSRVIRGKDGGNDGWEGGRVPSEVG